MKPPMYKIKKDGLHEASRPFAYLSLIRPFAAG